MYRKRKDVYNRLYYTAPNFLTFSVFSRNVSVNSSWYITSGKFTDEHEQENMQFILLEVKGSTTK